MDNIQWDKIKFRASSWGNLLTGTKTDRNAIGDTCAKELIRIYNKEVYGRKKDITTKQMDKGTLAEPDSIRLLSIVEGEIYHKNEEQLENEWFTGHPDIYTGTSISKTDIVGDIKTSWDIHTFMPKLIEGIDKGYEAQLNVYYDLVGASGGFIAHCLVSAPEIILEKEKYHLLRNMDVISEESPEYLSAVADLEKEMTFDDIDPRERVIKTEVPKNDELIQKMKDKVPILRKWLQDFHQKHMNQYPKN